MCSLYENIKQVLTLFFELKDQEIFVWSTEKGD